MRDAIQDGPSALSWASVPPPYRSSSDSSPRPEWEDGSGAQPARRGRKTSLSQPPIAMTGANELRLIDRYEFRSVLGEGGMGEIRLVYDNAIRREVAMKVLLPARQNQARQRARFFREANVQGMLDHPAVVPLYDMGSLPSGEPYFTMKLVRGMTLHDVLEGYRREDPRVTSRFTVRRVLSAFSTACRAIDHAHQRGIVHRDLKPENLMLGDHNEVYVLDWGLSRLVENSRLSGPAFGRATLSDANDLIGTPGYMAPEQIDASDEVETPADVYALGALLFEILTLQPLNDGTNTRARIDTTRLGPEARCSVRAPERRVPAELEAWCVRATQHDPASRPHARQMHEALEAILEADREADKKRVVADLHLRAARDSAQRAAVADPSTSGQEQRAALRSYARALSADPQNEDAVVELVELLEKPLPIPEEAKRTLRAEERRAAETLFGSLRWGRASWLLYLPLAALLGVADWRAAIILLSAVLSSFGLTYALEQTPNAKPWMRTAVAVFSLVCIAPVGMFFSPLIQVPALLAVTITAFSLELDRRGRAIATAAAALTALGPLVLEWMGVLAPSIVLDGRSITILPRMTHFPVVPTWIALTLFTLAPIVTMPILMGRVRGELARSRRRVHGHAWRLRQLLPRASRKSTTPPPR
jgi:eukaryotic-like serine/threonine-protein kinase